MTSGHRVLFADDTAMFRELGRLFLARHAEVSTANNGYESLALLRARPFDAVVADLDMPCMGGAELCRRMKRDSVLSQVPIILMTGTDLAEDHARAVRCGADDVLVKPLTRQRLAGAVERLLRKGRREGLMRAPVSAAIRLVAGEREQRGRAVNLSRGGIFVELDEPLSASDELRLRFQLPEGDRELAPTARVRWMRQPVTGERPGVGLQFVAVDRPSVERIADFVYAHAPAEVGPSAAAGTGS